MRTVLSRRELEFEAPAEVSEEEAGKLEALGYLSRSAAVGAGPLPNPMEALPSLGELGAASDLIEDKKYAEAETILRALVEQYPAMMVARAQLATCLSALRRPQEALDQLLVAREMTPEAAPGLAIKIAKALLQLGRPAEAAAEAESALPFNPSEAHELLAHSFLARRDLGQAAEQARLAVEADRIGRPEAIRLLARIHLLQGRPEDALAILDPLQRQVQAGNLPAVPALQSFRGDALARLGRNNEAEEAFLQEIRDFPGNLQAYVDLAILYATSGRVDRADAILTQMVEARPAPPTYRLAADIASRLGRSELAKAWREQASRSAG